MIQRSYSDLVDLNNTLKRMTLSVPEAALAIKLPADATAVSTKDILKILYIIQYLFSLLQITVKMNRLFRNTFKW